VYLAATVFSCVQFLISSETFAETPKIPDSVFQELLKKADMALSMGDKKKADLWIARYLGFSAMDPTSGRSSRDLEKLLKKRKLIPKAFISGEWDKGFIDWFEKSLYSRWGTDEKKMRVRQGSFQITENSYQDKYFAMIVAYPKLELWHAVENSFVSRPLLLPMGSALDRPMLFFGKIINGFPSSQFISLYLDTEKKSLHYVWKPEFYDLDHDGIPEVWVRFSIARDDGFCQILDIYHIQNENELVPLKRFRSGDDGLARRLEDDRVELGTAFCSQKIKSRFNNDQHHLETWQYKNGNFEKIYEKDVPLIFKSHDWKNYFLEN
jgi:hypothetical protein